MKRFEVKVLGAPKMELTEHDGKTAIKCSAEGFNTPPKISWLFENGLEINAVPQYHCKNRSGKCSSLDILLVQSHKSAVVVTCIVRHPDLHNVSHLFNFVRVGQDPTKRPFSSSTFSNRASTDRKTDTAATSASGSHQTIASTESWVHSSESKTTKHSLYDTSSDSTRSDATTVNSTNPNLKQTVGERESDSRRGDERNAPLLIFLVAFLIVCLLVVVAFFLVKLRRAHVLWKRENEDSDQSVESSKSKTSHDEKQERRAQVPANARFAKYVIEEETESKRTADANVKGPPNIREPPTTCVETTKANVKETEL